MKNITTYPAMFLFALLLSCGPSKKIPVNNAGTVIIILPDTSSVVNKTVKKDSVLFKYAKRLMVSEEELKNIKLYCFIDKWMNTPYKWGGTDEKGIDCSAFMQLLLTEVYKINIPRTSVQQFLTQQVEQFGSKNYLSEGDLVFFKTIDNTVVSHVGLYLQNRMFVNSSSSKGVSIANLDAPYWKKRFVAAGRLKASMAKK